MGGRPPPYLSESQQYRDCLYDDEVNIASASKIMGQHP